MKTFRPSALLSLFGLISVLMLNSLHAEERSPEQLLANRSFQCTHGESTEWVTFLIESGEFVMIIESRSPSGESYFREARLGSLNPERSEDRLVFSYRAKVELNVGYHYRVTGMRKVTIDLGYRGDVERIRFQEFAGLGYENEIFTCTVL